MFLYSFSTSTVCSFIQWKILNMFISNTVTASHDTQEIPLAVREARTPVIIMQAGAANEICLDF